MEFSLPWVFLIVFVSALIITPFIIWLALKIGVVDHPDERKVHTRLMPRLGGLAIFLAIVVGYFVSGLYHEQMNSIILGLIVIVGLGVVDDMYGLTARFKFLVEIGVACIIVFGSGLVIHFVTLPYFGKIELGFFGYILTIVWIVGITNAINLIDGLDGLSAGVSAIVLSTIGVLAFFGGKIMILTMVVVSVAAILGFLVYNFYPAKIFMGDTGSLLLGYLIAVISLLGLYKSVTLFSFIVPIMILGVPIFDTLFAIIRRAVNRKPISAPDKSHIHHRLLALGFEHRTTVILIYIFSFMFSASALLLSGSSTLLGSFVLIVAIILFLEFIVELTGLVSTRYRPLMKFVGKLRRKKG